MTGQLFFRIPFSSIKPQNPVYADVDTLAGRDHYPEAAKDFTCGAIMCIKNLRRVSHDNDA